MTSQKQMKLIMENWRQFIDEQHQAFSSSELEEGVLDAAKEKVLNAVKEKLSKAKETINNNIKEYSDNIPHLKEFISSTPNEKHKNLVEKIDEATKVVNQSKGVVKEAIEHVLKNPGTANLLLERISLEEKKILKENKKSIEEELLEEVGLLTGAFVGFGLTLLIVKGLNWVGDHVKWKGIPTFKTAIKKILVALEVVEEAIKLFVSALVVFDVAAYGVIYLALNHARNTGKGVLFNMFKSAGIELLLDKGNAIPQWSSFIIWNKPEFHNVWKSLNDVKKTAHDIEHHLDSDEERRGKRTDKVVGAVKKGAEKVAGAALKSAVPTQSGLTQENLEKIIFQEAVKLLKENNLFFEGGHGEEPTPKRGAGMETYDYTFFAELKSKEQNVQSLQDWFTDKGFPNEQERAKKEAEYVKRIQQEIKKLVALNKRIAMVIVISLMAGSHILHGVIDISVATHVAEAGKEMVAGGIEAVAQA